MFVCVFMDVCVFLCLAVLFSSIFYSFSSAVFHVIVKNDYLLYRKGYKISNVACRSSSSLLKLVALVAILLIAENIGGVKVACLIIMVSFFL